MDQSVDFVILNQLVDVLIWVMSILDTVNSKPDVRFEEVHLPGKQDPSISQTLASTEKDWILVIIDFAIS